MANSINLSAVQDTVRQASGEFGRSESIRSVSRPLPDNSQQQGAPETVNREAGAPAVNSAVSKINDFVQVVQRDLEFSVDDETGRTVITVRDSETDEVIRQIPPEEILAIAENLDEVTGLLFKGQA